jgi:hypothetical protein
MVAADLFNEYRLTGLLLILAFVSFAIGGTLPVVGEKGNMGIFTLPVREHLLTVAGNDVAWRWANIFMGAAAVILLAGLTMLTTLLEGANERILARLGLIGFLLAAALWVIFSAFRATVTIRAAQEMTSTATTGAVPAYYVMSRWLNGGSRCSTSMLWWASSLWPLMEVPCSRPACYRRGSDGLQSSSIS